MADAIEETKAGLRSLVRERLRALSAHERVRLSGAACEQALAWQPLTSAACVLAFAPMPSEVKIEPLIGALLARGATVCVPRMDWRSGTIEPVPVSDLEVDLDVLERGVRQPRALIPAIGLDEIEVVIVPGVAFDERGGRLGRGGGFYDRLLGDRARRGRAIGVAFEAQVLDLIPMQPHDQHVDALATPARLLEFDATERAGRA